MTISTRTDRILLLIIKITIITPIVIRAYIRALEHVEQW